MCIVGQYLKFLASAGWHVYRKTDALHTQAPVALNPFRFTPVPLAGRIPTSRDLPALGTESRFIGDLSGEAVAYQVPLTRGI